MSDLSLMRMKPTDADLDFVVEEVAPDAKDKARLRRLILEDEDFRNAMVGDDRVFHRVMTDQEIIVRISPALYFEVLLRRAVSELERASHTVERTGSQAIPVFDVQEVMRLLEHRPILYYLADMLSSFTRIEAHALPVRVRRGLWRKHRFNDMDIDGLIRLANSVDEGYRFGLYKRIADVCLFILGVYPEYAYFDYRYPASGQVRPPVAGRVRQGMEDYEEEGRRFYRLAGEHPSAHARELSEVFGLLHDHFNAAKKPLSFISQHYFRHRKRALFGQASQEG